MTEAMQILVGLLADARHKLKTADFGSYTEMRLLLDQSLDKLERALHRRPTVVVAGESNSGKTSVANMLAGLDVLPAAVIANTTVPVSLRHGIVPAVSAVTTNGRVPLSMLAIDEPLPKFLMGGLERIEVELPGMRDAGFEILDTPAWPVEGLASETADILIWCSVAARPWTESERRAMIELPARLRDRSLLAITNKDALAPAERVRVLSRYKELAGPHFTDMVMIDAAFEQPDDEDEEVLAQNSKGDHAALLDALEQLVDDYWNHRAMTGRRLCRHIARSLRPGIPPRQGENGTTAVSDPDPVSAILINIAGRLATV
jgi:energy-coupling factor transporter ATP-binding protein EcfA2